MVGIGVLNQFQGLMIYLVHETLLFLDWMADEVDGLLDNPTAVWMLG